MPGSSEVNAINRQKFLAELAKLLSFMYEEDRRYALDMYERMFDIAEGSEQWLIQNLMSPTRQAVLIARSYNAKERKLSVSAEWKEEEEDQSKETPPFVLAINKIFDDLFPDNGDPEETDRDQVSFFDQDKKEKKNKMPKAAVLLNQTQEFESVTASAAEEMSLEDILEEEDQEDDWTDRSALAAETNIETEPDPRVQIVDREEVYDSAEEEPVSEVGTKPAEAASDSETAVQTGAETSEQGSAPQRGTEANAEELVKETPQTREQSKKRRSIEELLGFRKEKKRSEGLEQNTAEPAEGTAQTAKARPGPVEPAEKAEAESVEPIDADLSSRSMPDQKDQVEASAKTSVKVVPLEAPVVLPEEESSSIKAEPIIPADSSSLEENETQKKNIKAVESQSVADNQREQNTESKEPQKLFFELPEEEPIIRKPEPKRKEEAIPVRRVPNVPAMILFFIIAIPSVPVMLVLLALLVALCVSLSFGTIALGSILVISAFSGFAVLADILLLLGAAIIALALGLLFLWLAIWLIAEGMVGLIRSVKELYREWCYKEVPAA